MTSQTLDRTHPVLALTAGLRARLDQVAASPTWSMRSEELREALVEPGPRRDAAGGPASPGARRGRDPWRHQRDRRRDGCRLGCGGDEADPAEARADLRLATDLEAHPVLAEALGRGALNPAQARVIVAALQRLPLQGEPAVDSAQRAAAEAHLLALAAHHDACDLAMLGRRILEVVAPDLADAYEGRVLEQQEARALRRTTLSMVTDDEGTCHGRFRIPLLHGAILAKVLHALSRTDDAEQPAPVRRGLAFTRLLETVPATSLPRAGGCSATVVVTMTLDHLLGRLHGACVLDTGDQVSAGEARRLACGAGLVPAVLGGDVSAHHDRPWSRGGPTSIADGRLLCVHHHRRIHDPAYDVTHHPNGTVSFHRRT